jgi:hypothetical protein
MTPYSRTVEGPTLFLPVSHDRMTLAFDFLHFDKPADKVLSTAKKSAIGMLKPERARRHARKR